LTRRRFGRLAGLAVAAVALAACDKAANGEGSSAAPVAGEVNAGEVYRTAEGGYAMGSPDAPLKLIEFASFTCGHCAEFHEQVVPKIKEKYVATGKLQFEVRAFLRNEPDLAAAVLVDCAGPERFEAMADLIFSSQATWLARGNDYVAYVGELAKKAGIPSARYEQCANSLERKKAAIAVTQMGLQTYTIPGTPTLVLNGEVVERGAVWEELEKAIEDKL